MAKLVKIKYKTSLLAVIASLTGLIACTKSLPYKTVSKDKVLAKSIVDTSADYLYIPSTGSISKGQGPSIPYFLTGQKVVRLQFTEKTLRAYEVPSDPTLRQNSKNNKLVMEIPIDHLDYQCSTDRVGQCKNEEEENKDLSWDKKSKFKPDFSKVTFGDVNLMPESYVKYFQSTNCMVEASSQLTDYSIDENQIRFQQEKSFNINPNCADLGKAQSLSGLSSTVNTSYTLIKLSSIASKDYQPLSYSGAAKNKYGFFRTSLQTQDVDSEERAPGHTDLVNRWNPNRGVVSYTLSESFNKPQFALLKRATYSIFTSINQSLKEAHSTLQFELQDYSQQDSTDLRLNQIILAEDFSMQATAYSPVVVNPLTGEILKGRIVFYADSLKSQVQNLYRRYMFNLEQEKIKKVKREVQSNEMVTSFESYLATQNSCLFNSDFGTVSQSLIKKISKFTAKNPKSWESLTQDEMQNIIDLLMPDLYAQILVHEMGHNLGLRHNFAGSFDGQSSVMDYSFDFGKSSYQFGKYDISALKFAYSDQAAILSESSSYKYCSDENVGVDPSCQQDDEGTSLVESATSLINKYKYNHSTASVRGQRQNFNLFQDLHYSKNIDKIFSRLRAFQEKYERRKYELDLTDSDEQWKKDNELKDVKASALLVGNFFLDIIEAPDLTCLVASKSNPNIITKIFLLKKINSHVTSCSQLKMEQGDVLFGQYGESFLPVEPVGFEASSEYKIEKRGLWIDKVLASKYLLSRVFAENESISIAVAKYFDNYTDNFFDHSELQVRMTQLVADLAIGDHKADQIVQKPDGQYVVKTLPVLANDFDIPRHVDAALTQYLKIPNRITSLVEILGLQIVKQAQDEPFANMNARRFLDFVGVYKTPAVAGALQSGDKSVILNGITWGYADEKTNKIAAALISQIKSAKIYEQLIQTEGNVNKQKEILAKAEIARKTSQASSKNIPAGPSVQIQQVLLNMTQPQFETVKAWVEHGERADLQTLEYQLKQLPVLN